MSFKNFFLNLFKEKQTKPKKSFEEIYSDLGVFEYLEDGFIITTDEFSKTIMYDDILEMNAYKKDLLAYDIIVIEMIHQKNVLTINEETPGWYQFVIKTKEIFEIIPQDWELEITQPPFERNFTNLYKK